MFLCKRGVIFSWGGRGFPGVGVGYAQASQGGTYKSVQFLLLIFKILKTVLIMDPRCLAYHTALHAPIESKHTTPPDLEERGTRTVAHNMPQRVICLVACATGHSELSRQTLLSRPPAPGPAQYGRGRPEACDERRVERRGLPRASSAGPPDAASSSMDEKSSSKGVGGGGGASGGGPRRICARTIACRCSAMSAWSDLRWSAMSSRAISSMRPSPMSAAEGGG